MVFINFLSQRIVVIKRLVLAVVFIRCAGSAGCG